MPTFTANYGLSKPLVNNATDQDLWGGELNGDLDELDVLLKTGFNWSSSPQTLNFSVSAPTTGSATIGSTKLLYQIDSTLSNVTASLPAAASCAGMAVAFRRIDSGANTISITANGAEIINGLVTRTLLLQYDYLIIASDGTSWSIISQTPPAVINPSKGAQIFLSSGTFTTPADTVSSTLFKFTVTGAGGGSGGVSNGSAGGAGAGSTAITYFTGLTASLGCAIIIGAQGTAGTSGGGNGGAGGNTTVTVNASTIIAPGGGGSNGASGTSFATPGQGGGTCTNAAINILGGGGSSGAYNSTGNAYFSGQGGSSFWGGGGRARNAGAEGNQGGLGGQAYGSGAGGAISTGNAAGALGAAGIVLVEWQ